MILITVFGRIIDHKGTGKMDECLLKKKLIWTGVYREINSSYCHIFLYYLQPTRNCDGIHASE